MGWIWPASLVSSTFDLENGKKRERIFLILGKTLCKAVWGVLG